MTPAQFRVSEGGRRVGERSQLQFTEPAALAGTEHLLTAGIDFEVIDTGSTGSDRYRVTTHGYKYQVVTADLDEVVLFHWHPYTTESGKPLTVHPHIHLGERLLAKKGPLSRKAHIPSGRVAFEDVVEFVINECGARPSRRDWKLVLDKSRDDFRSHSSWGGGRPAGAIPPA